MYGFFLFNIFSEEPVFYEYKEGELKIQEIKPGFYNVQIEYMGFSPITFYDIKLSFRDNRVKNMNNEICFYIFKNNENIFLHFQCIFPLKIYE